MRGIDTSVYQSSVEWCKVRAAGIEFAMIKASQGGLIKNSGIAPFEDRAFLQNVRAASAAGIKCGAYHFLTGTTREEVLREAEFFISVLDKVREYITFPCAVDMEAERYTYKDKDYNARLLRVFCAAVAEAGYIPMIYTNRAFSLHFINMNMLSEYDVWFALYRKSGADGPMPDDVKNITIWQWGTDLVDGVMGRVDMDICTKDYFAQLTVRVGDIVRVREDAVYYFPGGPRIPEWVKSRRYRVSRTAVNGEDIIRGGEKCVLLGAYIDENGSAQGNIMTWISVQNIEVPTRCGGNDE